jgi:hypothetical protein
MAKVKSEPCPKCRANGRDRRGDNLARYPDGGGHCFSCGHHEFPRALLTSKVRKDDHGAENQTVLPSDFTEDVPARAWRWLLSYGLPYTYWRPFVGWSERDQRLIFKVGSPVRFSQGRYFGDATERPPAKWWVYGERSGVSDVLRPEKGSATEAVVLVEDIISWHKVGQVAPSICLFGVKMPDELVRKLIALKRPVIVWLDRDQLALLAPKLNRLQTFLRASVQYVSTEKDPKAYSLDEIKEILNAVDGVQVADGTQQATT